MHGRTLIVFTGKLADMLADPRSRYDYEEVMKEYNEVLQEQFTAQQAIRKLFSRHGWDNRQTRINKRFKLI